MRRPCIGQPISWLELEHYALGESVDANATAQHLDACTSCDALVQSIRDDKRRMPALLVPLATPRPPWFRWRWALVLAPALALLLFWLVPHGVGESNHKAVHNDTGWKGGSATMTLIREREGVLLEPTHFAPEDRFKVEVSCAPGRHSMQVAIVQDSETFFPLPTSMQDCGNHTLLPGAFSLDGGPALICVSVGQSGESVCQMLNPEP
jgi:hypothetical protein